LCWKTTNISSKGKTKVKGKGKAGKKDQSKKVATANGTEQNGKDLICQSIKIIIDTRFGTEILDTKEPKAGKQVYKAM